MLSNRKRHIKMSRVDSILFSSRFGIRPWRRIEKSRGAISAAEVRRVVHMAVFWELAEKTERE